MLFYYTATGNCLYIAKQIDKKIYSIPQELKKEQLNYQAEKIGLVAPIYAGELPKTVRKFIETAHFETDYFYLVLTYGKEDSVGAVWSENFCQKQGIKVHYAHTIKMVDNYLPSFDMEEEMAIDKKIDEQLQEIIKDLQARKQFIKQPTEIGAKLYEIVCQRNQEHPEINNGEAITMTDRCNGCKICEQVCPIGNIKVIDGKAVRLSKVCDFCLACVQNCPFKAIDLDRDKNPQARYRHPKISLKEIVQSNHQ